VNRFPTTRRNQILAWTGAALAWCTTFLASIVEPDRVDPNDSQTVESTVQVSESMPQAPETGLTIIRFRPPEKIEQPFVPIAVANPAPSAPQPVESAPAPASSGS
jgi:hypothetical protein